MTPWRTEETSLPGREVSSVLQGVIIYPLTGSVRHAVESAQNG